MELYSRFGEDTFCIGHSRNIYAMAHCEPCVKAMKLASNNFQEPVSYMTNSWWQWNCLNICYKKGN